MTEDEMTEALFLELIVHMAAWRRLKTVIMRTIEADPEEFGAEGKRLLKIMNDCYDAAYMDLLKGQSDLEKQIKKQQKEKR